MKLDLKPTQRGFLRADFTDLYGEACSIQESSLATEDALWLGCGNERMHLTPEMVEALIPLLERFVRTGGLFDGNDEDATTEREEEDHLRELMADLLTRTANALKGEPRELTRHSWHDLPEVAKCIAEQNR